MSKGGGGDLWERLEELAFAFKFAADQNEDPELDRMGAVLTALWKVPEYRDKAETALRSFLAETEGIPARRPAWEATRLKETVELLRHREPEMIAESLVTMLSMLPNLRGRTPGARPLFDPDGAAHDDAVRLVSDAIAPLLDDPAGMDAEGAVLAALRALGATRIKDLFQRSARKT